MAYAMPVGNNNQSTRATAPHRARLYIAMMSAGVAPTPPHEDPPSGQYAAYVPHDLRYSEAFEDCLMRLVLHSGEQAGGIRVLGEDSGEQPIDGVSVRLEDISTHSLPTLTEDHLPLPLNDSRRIFATPIPGIRLTHPGGYLEGGPGLDPDMDTFPGDFFDSHDVGNADELRRTLDEEIASHVQLLRKRMRARARAMERNQEVGKQLRTLRDQRETELKVYAKLKADVDAKKARREERRKTRDGG